LDTNKKLKAMQEILRVLVPNGKLYTADFGKQENPIFVLIGKIAIKFEPELDVNFNGKLPKLLESAGFKNVKTLKTYNTKLGTICIYSGEKAD